MVEGGLASTKRHTPVRPHLWILHELANLAKHHTLPVSEIKVGRTDTYRCLSMSIFCLMSANWSSFPWSPTELPCLFLLIYISSWISARLWTVEAELHCCPIWLPSPCLERYLHNILTPQPYFRLLYWRGRLTIIYLFWPL